MKVKVGVSNRHIHLSEEDFNVLFGEESNLSNLRDLYQTGQYACNETCSLVNGERIINKVRIIGPHRAKSLVEISMTDAYYLKVHEEIKLINEDSNLTIKVVGPKGSLNIPVYISNRHIHMKEDECEKYGLYNGDIVSLKVEGKKGGIISNVYVKTDPNYKFECHLDTDDSNAFLIKHGDMVEIIKEN